MSVDLWHYGSKERLENGCLGGSGEQGAIQGAVGHLILYQNEVIGARSVNMTSTCQRQQLFALYDSRNCQLPQQT